MSEILGAFFGVMVGLMFLPQIVQGIVVQRQTQSDVSTAQQLQQWSSAVSSYVGSNMLSLGAVATATTPVTISVATVQAANVGLQTGFTGTNPFNQTWTAQVLQPSAGKLQVLIFATGGTVIKDQELGAIAREAGGYGGFIPSNNSGVYSGGAAKAYGSFAGWSISTTGYSPIVGGHPASLLNFSNGTLTSNYLYRNAVPGQPQLNEMNTDLNMGSNNITNANQVQTAAGNGVQVGSSYLYGDSTNSAIRQNGTFFVQNQAGTAPAPMSVGTITSGGDINASGNITAGGNLQVNGSAVVSGNVTATDVVTNNLVPQSGLNGTITAFGTFYGFGGFLTDGDVTFTHDAAIGTACSGWEITGGNNGTGDLVQCKNGLWEPIHGTLFSSASGSAGYSPVGAYWYSTPTAVCPPGSQVVSVQGTCNGTSAVHMWATTINNPTTAQVGCIDTSQTGATSYATNMCMSN